MFRGLGFSVYTGNASSEIRKFLRNGRTVHVKKFHWFSRWCSRESGGVDPIIMNL